MAGEAGLKQQALAETSSCSRSTTVGSRSNPEPQPPGRGPVRCRESVASSSQDPSAQGKVPEPRADSSYGSEPSAERGQQHARFVCWWQHVNREKRWQDQAVRVNYNPWPSLSAKTQKSHLYPFSLLLFIQTEETCIGEHEEGVRRVTFLQVLKTKSYVSRTAALSQQVSSETSAVRSSKQSPRPRKGRERKSRGFK